MKKSWVLVFCMLSRVAWGVTDGIEVSNGTASGNPNTGMRCFDICDGKTTAADCGPFANPPGMDHVVIKVERAVNAGSACTFDDWGVYENRTNTTPSATNTFGALCAIDDDTTTTVVGATAGAECKIFGPLLNWTFIDAGTLGTCSDFTIIACFFPKK